MKTIINKYIFLLLTMLTAKITFAQAPTISYPSTQSYTANVPISAVTPTYSGSAATPNGQTLTFAGSGSAGSANGTGTSASFNQPLGTAVDASGNIYVADAVNDLIRKITPAGVVTTFAGSGTQGSVDGTGTSASFWHPVGLCVDASGNIYVADEDNNKIRKITPSGVVSTFAGSGAQGSADGTGTAATFYNPFGLAVDASGNVYVGDNSNNKIRKITSAGVVSTIAGSGTVGSADGTGTAATFNQPSSVTLDLSGNLYIADRYNHKIRKLVIATGVVSTLAGSGTIGSANGTGSAASFNYPTTIIADASGNVYVADYHNNMIRKVTSAGVVTTLAGNTTAGSTNGMGSTATFNYPFAISIDASGYLYVGDLNTNLIRKVATTAFGVTPYLPAGLSFNTGTGVITGTPTVIQSATNYTVSAYNTVSPGVGSVTFSITITAQPVFNPSQTSNYVARFTPRVNGLTSNASINAVVNNPTQVQTNIQYIDDIGRPIQTVEVKGNGNATKDIIHPVVYDAYGRERTKYLPYADGASAPGSYRSNALIAGNGDRAFYMSPSAGVTATDAPYAQTGFDGSPLDKVLTQGAAGDAWQLSAGHVVVKDYEVNAASNVQQYVANSGTVPGFEYQSTLANSGYYNAGELYLTITKDENWTSSMGKVGTTEEYQNKDGQVVLRRQYNTGGVILSTYYVYDYRKNLSFVLPPGVNPDAGTTLTTAMLNNFCYQYRYDGRNRLIEKKLPGKGWEYMVYDPSDQLVMHQDAIQQNSGQWEFIKYDGYGRPVITGIYSSSNSRATQQSNVNAQTTFAEATATTSTGYTNNVLPTTGISYYLTINYYDNYTFPTASTVAAANNYVNPGQNLPTGTLVYLADGSASYLTATYYDQEERPTEIVSQNHLGGIDRLVNTYDFTGGLTNSVHTQTANSQTTTINTGYVYDHMGRKTQTTESINGTTPIILSQINYNDVGQPYTKGLHSENYGASFLQTVTYSYNERGWLRTANTNGSFFNLDLRYNTPNTGTAQYNGNISEMLYMGQYSGSKTLNYSYDAINRLTATSSGGTLDETVGYDNMGNIISMVRGGNIPANLSYNYVDGSGNASNQLQSVTNNGSAYRTYGYDVNGNATSDGGSKNINYNLLNLPKSLTQSGSTIATYIYDATGTKLHTTSNADGTWDYVKGVVYHNNAIAFILTDEGKAIPNGSTFQYEYNLKDQLGNVRVTFYKNTSGAAQVVQEDEYYSFGLRSPKYDNANGNRYLYNEKELQIDLASQYDYGARFYDPVIGRWNTVDPLAEKNRRWSPYAYVDDNPIRNIDPDGMERQGVRETPDDAAMQQMSSEPDDSGMNDNSWETDDEKVADAATQGKKDAEALYARVSNGLVSSTNRVSKPGPSSVICTPYGAFYVSTSSFTDRDPKGGPYSGMDLTIRFVANKKYENLSFQWLQTIDDEERGYPGGQPDEHDVDKIDGLGPPPFMRSVDDNAYLAQRYKSTAAASDEPFTNARFRVFEAKTTLLIVRANIIFSTVTISWGYHSIGQVVSIDPISFSTTPPKVQNRIINTFNNTNTYGNWK